MAALYWKRNMSLQSMRGKYSQILYIQAGEKRKNRASFRKKKYDIYKIKCLDKKLIICTLPQLQILTEIIKALQCTGTILSQRILSLYTV